jgi:hypothetical protein
MRLFHAMPVALLSAALVLNLPARGFAEDDKSTAKTAAADKSSDKTADKTAEKAIADSTTSGTVDAGGQHIAYTAVAGTITVGATNMDDAQLGADGKPEAGSQLALDETKEPRDASPVARMFYFAYFKKDAKAWDLWAPSTWSQTPTSTCPRLRTS